MPGRVLLPDNLHGFVDRERVELLVERRLEHAEASLADAPRQ
jgi:hypothetical protein